MDGSPLRLRLWVVHHAPNSVAALRNLREALGGRVPDAALEVLDVFDEPARALADGAFVTPMLVRLEPGPAARLVGTLEDPRLLENLLAPLRRGA